MGVSIKASLSIVAVCMALVGCSGIIDPAVGQGPIALSPDVEKGFAEYKARNAPRFFAVSTDGNVYYYSFCDVGRCLKQLKTQVIRKCEANSGGVPCKIYGSRGEIVWAATN